MRAQDLTIICVLFVVADENIDASTLLEQYRRVKSDLLNFRNLM